MTSPRLTESPIDHHIQAHIVRVLFASGEAAVPFSSLKPDDVQNSLFMYHLGKLERRGVVARIDGGFVLTPDGVRWINFVSPDKLQPQLAPRVLVRFLVFSPDRTQLVVSRRTTAAADYVGEYLLPGGFQRYGLSFGESAAALAQILLGSSPELTALGICETIDRYGDYVHHVVSPLYEATCDITDFPADDHYAMQWVSVADVRAGSYGTTLAELLAWHAAGHTFAGASSRIDHQ